MEISARTASDQTQVVNLKSWSIIPVKECTVCRRYAIFQNTWFASRCL